MIPSDVPARKPRRGPATRVAVVVVVLLVGTVVAHDAVCSVTFGSGLLCERPDGSLWRDASYGCSGGEDPACLEPCVDSTPLAEGPRTSCNWLLMRTERPATGDPPHHTGPSPGTGGPA